MTMTPNGRKLADALEAEGIIYKDRGSIYLLPTEGPVADEIEAAALALFPTTTSGGGTDAVTLADLHHANIARQNEWCPDQHPDLSFRGNELGGEVGEALNIIKKLERERLGWRGSRSTVEALAEELADVVICADLCAITAGIDLSAAVVAKFNATSEKVGISVRLSTPTDRHGVAGGDAGLREALDDAEEAAYNLGKEEGAAGAIQRVAERLGIDSEYRWSSDPERRQPGPVELLDRIVEHFAALTPTAPPSPRVSGDREALDPRVDQQVWSAAKSLSDEERRQPEWLWLEMDGRVTYGRWKKHPAQAPYVRADIALASPPPAEMAGVEEKERRDEDGFVCEYDPGLTSASDDFTISWENGARWLVVRRDGRIVAGVSPSDGHQPFCSTFAALRTRQDTRAGGAVEGWQPIETAPKDVPVIVYSPACEREKLTEWVRVDLVYAAPFRMPTHWMPLPATPTGTDDGEGA